MATLVEENINKGHFRDYILKLTDGDRIGIEANGEYITYLRLANGELSYLSTEKIRVI